MGYVIVCIISALLRHLAQPQLGQPISSSLYDAGTARLELRNLASKFYGTWLVILSTTINVVPFHLDGVKDANLKKPSDNMVASSVSPTLDGGSITSFTIPCKQTPVSTDTDSVTTPTADETETLDTENTKSQPLKRKKKPVPGKGFSKSRQGCYNCKRRRVKCSEAKPECCSCNRMGLICVYPEAPRPTLKRSHNTVSSSSKSCVNLNHLQFYHHFLLEAYPPAPHGAEPVWRNVAAMSHEVCSSTRTSTNSA